MINAFFLDIRNGKLTRLPFFGYSVLLNVLGLVFIFGIIAAIAGTETVMGGDLSEAQAVLRKTFTGPLIIVLIVFFVTAVFATLNMAAKRIRDIGLPGWLTVLALAAILIAFSLLAPGKASQSFGFISWIILLLIPSGMMKKE